ncbi:MAG: FUSC family protein [Prochlorococcaceae cyanobacterium]
MNTGATPLQATLRLALTVAVVQGFAQFSGLSDGTYASLAVLSVTVGSYGDTLELGRQRLVGTTVGAVVLFIAYPALQGVPLMLGLPLAVVLARLLAAACRLQVGYTVCVYVVIAGWLGHAAQLETWVPLRLFWTAFGVIMALLSLRLFWPSRARQLQRQGLLDLLQRLAQALGELPQSPDRRRTATQLRQLRDDLLALRSQRATALRELGSAASSHPLAKLWQALDDHSETLILVLNGLQRLQSVPWTQTGLVELERRLSGRLVAMQQQMAQWRKQLLADPLNVPGPPQPLWQAENLMTWLGDHPPESLSPELLDRLANGLLLLDRLELSFQECERAWSRAVSAAVLPGSLRP